MVRCRFSRPSERSRGTLLLGVGIAVRFDDAFKVRVLAKDAVVIPRGYAVVLVIDKVLEPRLEVVVKDLRLIGRPIIVSVVAR